MDHEPRVLALALRTSVRGPMHEVEVASAEPNGGLQGDHGTSARRGITFLAKEDWEAACRAVGADLPWHARRANVLVEGRGLLGLVGREVRVGELRIRVEGETCPCARMDERRSGLRAALEPEGRGGVYGRVLEGGTLRIGDVFETAGPGPASGR